MFLVPISVGTLLPSSARRYLRSLLASERLIGSQTATPAPICLHDHERIPEFLLLIWQRSTKLLFCRSSCLVAEGRGVGDANVHVSGVLRGHSHGRPPVERLLLRSIGDADFHVAGVRRGRRCRGPPVERPLPLGFLVQSA